MITEIEKKEKTLMNNRYSHSNHGYKGLYITVDLSPLNPKRIKMKETLRKNDFIKNTFKKHESNKIIDFFCYLASIHELSKFKSSEKTLDDIINTAYNYSGLGNYKNISPAQVKYEIKRLAKEVKKTKPETVLEIGTSNGGTLYIWSRYLKPTKKIISLDLPEGEFGGGYPKEKIKLFKKFSTAKELSFIRGDSHTQNSLKKVRALLEGEKVDFLFIDGDHSYEGVKRDFEMYRKLVSEDGLIAFHDILIHPKKPECKVYKFWNEIKQKYKTKEIIASENQDWAGIGIIKNHENNN